MIVKSSLQRLNRYVGNFFPDAPYRGPRFPILIVILTEDRELFTECGLRRISFLLVCIIIFSPDGKPYSFGYPSVDMVANRFLNLSPPSSNNPDPHRDIVSGLIQRYYDLLGLLDAEERRNEKRQKELLDQLEGHFCSILGAPRHQLNSGQLTKYRMMLEEVSEKIEKRIQELSMKGSGAIASSSGNSEGLIDLNVANPPEMETSGSP